MSAYISTTFEKTLLPTTSQVRVIARNRDGGSVPPAPSTTYFPTDPDALQYNIVGQFLSRATGEQFIAIAELADLTDVAKPVKALDTFEDLNVDFSAAGVTQGELLIVYLIDTEIWNSENYSGNPYYFTVQTVTATRLTVTPPFPAFASALTWSVPGVDLTGTAGVTLRNGNPSDGTFFRDARFQRYYPTALDAENSVVAMKASMTALTTEVVGASLISETVTLSSEI